MKEIATLLFDLDGTLYSSTAGIEFEIPKKVRKSLALHLGIGVEDARNLVMEGRKSVSHVSVFEYLRDVHRVNIDQMLEKAYSELSIDTIVCYEGLTEAISNISRYFDIYLITNSHRTHANRVLNKLNINQFFKKIFTPYEYSLQLKPSKVFFNDALSEINKNTESILYYDDSVHNIKAATQLGLKTVLVSNGISPPPLFWEMHSRKDYELPEYTTCHTFDIVNHLNGLYKEVNHD
jgi:putative hydrolase of the HAD superfamily